MMSDTQYGLPLIIENLKESAARGLKRIRLEKGSGDDVYKERWLQKLVSRYPNVLPIEQIEPALTDVVPICMELPLPSGYVDILYATPYGDLIVAETKLFRNPEARREVVAQVIDYAKDLSALSYEKLQDAIFRAEVPDGSGSHPKLGLYEAVGSIAGREEINEERFIDAVSRNLERGPVLAAGHRRRNKGRHRKHCGLPSATCGHALYIRSRGVGDFRTACRIRRRLPRSAAHPRQNEEH
jgi:hypothetical protein